MDDVFSPDSTFSHVHLALTAEFTSSQNNKSILSHALVSEHSGSNESAFPEELLAASARARRYSSWG